MNKTGRNDPCPCGSGRKYKQCCQQREAPAASNDSLGATADPAALQAALEHHRGGRLAQAQALYRKILDVAPDHVETLYNLGQVFLDQGKPDAAISSYRHALTLKPDYAEAHVNLGNALKVLGDLNEAATSYQRALSLRPGFAKAHYNLGNVFYEQGKPGEAVESYRRAITLKPDFADAQNNLGLALQTQGMLDEAIACYRKALAIKPDYANAHVNLGNALYGQGRLDEALASNRRTLALRPDYVEAHNNLGLTLAAQGMLDEATTCYRQALALNPDYAEAHVNLGNVLQTQGKLDEAIECYRRALASRPDFVEAYISLGSAFNERSGPESAKESVLYYQKAFSARTGLRYGGISELSPGLTDVYLELTNKCNFHCDFCPSDFLQRPQGYMNMELIRKVYGEVAEKKFAPQINLHLMGEPTLHPDLLEILAFGFSRNIRTSLVTNGSTMNAKSAPKILETLHGSLIVSLQTPTRVSYKHRGDVGLGWDRYIGNIRLLVREHLKRVTLKQAVHSTIELRVMVTKDSKLSANIIQTEEDVGAILHEWSDFVSGVELELGLPPCQRKEMLETAMKTTVAMQNGRSYLLQQGLKITFWQGFSFANSRLSSEYNIELSGTSKFCRHPFTDVGVLCNGDVTLCCLDYDGQLVVGNVRDDTLETAINGERARNLRAAMLSRHPMPSFCQQCQAEAIRSEPANLIVSS